MKAFMAEYGQTILVSVVTSVVGNLLIKLLPTIL